MSKKVIVTADSTCDLSAELKKRYSIKTLPLHINYEDKSYDDSVDITPPEIYQIFRSTKVLPKTSAINVDEYKEFFEPILKEGYDIIHINIGSGLSTSYQSCCIAAQDLGGVYPIDSCNLSTGTGLLVLEAAERAGKGMPAEQIADEVNAMVQKCHASFILDKLDFMKAGGRCSAVTLLGANLLNLKPCIVVDNTSGKMGVGKKYRGKLDKVLLNYIDETIAQYDSIKTTRAFITHSGISPEIEKMVYDYVKSKNIFKEVFVTTASCTISSHCGPNTLGLLFMTE